MSEDNLSQSNEETTEPSGAPEPVTEPAVGDGPSVGAVGDAPEPAVSVNTAEDDAPSAAETVEESAPSVSVTVSAAADEAGSGEERLAQPEPTPSEAAADYDRSFPQLEKGEVIKGTVVHIDREGVLVDVGAKSEGIIHPDELSRDVAAEAESVVSVGEKIDVLVLEAESADGSLILSKKRADFEKAWDRVIEAKETGKTITAMVTERVKGGLVVDLGIRGFVPASHVGSGSLKTNLDKYVGDTLDLKVIEVDRERRKVVLSNRDADHAQRQSRRQTTIASLEVGKTLTGTVRRLTTYGAFVDLGGIDGLLHISEMSWTRINDPSDVLKEGEQIEVQILKLDLENGRISLGRRQILPDPWSEIETTYTIGELIQGTVARIVPFGVFVQVKSGIEGIIPNSELSYRRGVKASDLVHPGAEVEVKVIDVRPDERKLTLSLKQARQDEEIRRERKAVDDYQGRADRESPRYTIGDAVRRQDDNDD